MYVEIYCVRVIQTITRVSKIFTWRWMFEKCEEKHSVIDSLGRTIKYFTILATFHLYKVQTVHKQ